MTVRLKTVNFFITTFYRNGHYSTFVTKQQLTLQWVAITFFSTKHFTFPCRNVVAVFRFVSIVRTEATEWLIVILGLTVILRYQLLVLFGHLGIQNDIIYARDFILLLPLVSILLVFSLRTEMKEMYISLVCDKPECSGWWSRRLPSAQFYLGKGNVTTFLLVSIWFHAECSHILIGFLSNNFILV